MIAQEFDPFGYILGKLLFIIHIWRLRAIGYYGFNLLSAEHCARAASPRDAFAGNSRGITDKVFARRTNHQLAIDFRESVLRLFGVLAPELTRIRDGDG